MASIPEIKTIPLAEPWFPPHYAMAVHDQVLSGFLGPGRAAQQFANDLAQWSGTAGCVLTVSGTVALSVAAKALGLEQGDEILVPAYGVISTINGLASAGLSPKLVDIDRATGCMSPERLIEAISARTKAVCYVNFSGHTGQNLVDVARICEERGIPLIEDAACALGQRHEGRAAGSFGTIGTYSFSVPKVLTTGQGGALVSHRRDLLDRAAEYVDHGDLEWRKTNLNRRIGTNLRYTDLQARLGLCQLDDLAERLERRRVCFGILRAALGKCIYQVPGPEAPLHNIVFTDSAAELVAALGARGITTVRQYRTISQHPAYASLAGDYPAADSWTERAVYLPFGMSLTAADAERIVRGIGESEVLLRPPDAL